MTSQEHTSRRNATKQCAGKTLDRVIPGDRRNRVGAAVVEFAMVAPIFIILVLGMIEMGRAIMVQQIMTNASREGARRAVLDSVSETDVQQAVVNYMGGAKITIAATDVAVATNPPVAPDFANSMTVTITVPFSQVSWLPSPIYFKGANSDLVASTTMRSESIE